MKTSSPKAHTSVPATKHKDILATRHKDKRANIPTEELRDFVADDENPEIMVCVAEHGKKEH